MKVLICVDRSDFSRAALDDCRAREWKPDTEFKIVSAIDFFEPLPALVPEKKKQIEKVQALINEYADLLKASHPELSCEGKVLDGYPKTAILEFADAWPADLIVVGSHGRTGIARLVLGSVSHAILVNAYCAVRIVRKGPQSGLVVIALDKTERSAIALKRVLESEWKPGSKFKVVSVLQSLYDYEAAEPGTAFVKMAEEQQTIATEKAKELLGMAVDQLNERFGADCASSELLNGDPRTAILNFAKESGAELIVMGSHGRNQLGRIIIGSVSEAVSINSPCSVEVVKPTGKNAPTLIV